MNLLSVLSSLQFSNARGVCDRSGLSLKGRPGLGALRVVVARSLLRIRYQPLPAALSANDRWGALRAQALAWQPFERTEVRYVLGTQGGLLLAWDASLTASLVAQQGLSPDKIEWIPEPMLQPAAPEACLRLVAGLDGFEGQHWEEGFLRASRWWAELPGERDWLDFARATAAQVHGADERLEPQELPLQPATWASFRGPHQRASQSLRAERWIVGGVGLVLVAASMPVLREYLALRQADQEVVAKLAELQEATRPVTKLREVAMAERLAAETLIAETAAVQPLDVLRYLSEFLPKEGVLLKEMDLNGRALRLTFELGAGVSRSTLVERMQAGRWFEAVSELPPGSQLNWISYQVTLGAASPVPVESPPSSPQVPSVGASGAKP